MMVYQHISPEVVVAFWQMIIGLFDFSNVNMTVILLTAYSHNNWPVYWVLGELYNYFVIRGHIHCFFTYQYTAATAERLIYVLVYATAPLSCIYYQSMFKYTQTYWLSA